MLRALVPQDNSVCPNLRVPGYCLANNEKIYTLYVTFNKP